jgi:hypothetical protein
MKVLEKKITEVVRKQEKALTPYNKIEDLIKNSPKAPTPPIGRAEK